MFTIGSSQAEVEQRSVGDALQVFVVWKAVKQYDNLESKPGQRNSLDSLCARPMRKCIGLMMMPAEAFYGRAC